MPNAKITFNDAGDRIFMNTGWFEDDGEKIGLAAAYARTEQIGDSCMTLIQ